MADRQGKISSGIARLPVRARTAHVNDVIYPQRIL